MKTYPDNRAFLRRLEQFQHFSTSRCANLIAHRKDQVHLRPKYERGSPTAAGQDLEVNP